MTVALISGPMLTFDVRIPGPLRDLIKEQVGLWLIVTHVIDPRETWDWRGPADCALSGWVELR